MSINGNSALYYYFKDVDEKNRSADKALLKHLVRSLAIWLPIELYRRLPVLLPFVVRDPTCRKPNNREKIEEWGSSDKKGYFRDDNTLVKAIPRKFTISGKNTAYDRQMMGAGFVASHIWSKLDSSSGLATRDPLTNTFVPNLVWLPSQISKLSDRKGSFIQNYLQALSFSIYHGVKLEENKTEFVEKIWDSLPKPIQKIKVEKNLNEKLNFFNMGEKDIEKKANKLLRHIELIRNEQVKGKVYCHRYLPSYSGRPTKKARSALSKKLAEYRDIIK